MVADERTAILATVELIVLRSTAAVFKFAAFAIIRSSLLLAHGQGERHIFACPRHP